MIAIILFLIGHAIVSMVFGSFINTASKGHLEMLDIAVATFLTSIVGGAAYAFMKLYMKDAIAVWQVKMVNDEGKTVIINKNAALIKEYENSGYKIVK